ncbi:MAG: GMC family oxidoreductase [Labilithrix sp.]|nr:GMC family oxidoreductase [Labilithrix sp.]
MSAKVLGNTTLTQFDVIVIGSGAGGCPVADVLTRFGKKVLVIEAGANHFEGLDDPRGYVTRFSNDEVKLFSRGLIATDPYLEPRTYRPTESAGDRTYVGDVNPLAKTVGGAAVHADLKMPRFAPVDFRLGTLLGAVPGAAFADWPVDYDMLEPFYAYVERTLGIQGQRGSDPFAGPMKDEYPMPPGPKMYCTVPIEAGAQKLGLTVFPYPTAVNSRPYGGRPPCVDCGFCAGYGCPSNAKGSPAVSMLRRALLSQLCQLVTETRAVRLLTNGAMNRVEGVECIGPDGARVTYRADAYVLAASPIEDARLLLASGGIGNASDMVGRCLTFHFQTVAIGVFDERLHSHRGRTVSHGFSDFRGVPNDPTKPLGGIVEISGSAGAVEESTFYTRILRTLSLQFDGLRFKRLMQQSPARERLVALVMQAEDAPQTKNRVDLDPAVKDLDGLPVARVTYENHAFELGARDFYSPKLMDLLAASGARYGFIAPMDEISTSAHVMGTLRFGRDPRTSVCDAAGRFHGVDNLYASDGALFPTSSGYNPTHTIVALATRIAGEMVFPGSPERVLA